MYISYQQLFAMTICAAISLFMLAMLFWTNNSLVKENRFLRSRNRSLRKRCEKEHASVPF
jgi:hypothetical protein